MFVGKVYIPMSHSGGGGDVTWFQIFLIFGSICWAIQILVAFLDKDSFTKKEFAFLLFVPVIPALFYLVKTIVDKFRE